MEFNQESVIAKFDHNKAELTKLVDASKMLSLSDPLDNKQVAVIKGKRIELRGYEIKIEKKGKEIREDAKTFMTGVLDYEKELKAVTSPEILRLEGLEEISSKAQLVEERKKLLPDRKEKLMGIDPNLIVDDNVLLELNATEFQDHLNKQVSIKLENDRKKLEDEKRAHEEQKLESEKAERAKTAAVEAEAEAKRKEAQALIDAENAKIVAERAAIEAEKQKLAHEEEVRKAAESARLKAEQDAKERAEREKVEADKKAAEAKLAEENRLAMLPDKESLKEYATALAAVELPKNLKTDEAEALLSRALEMLGEVINLLKK